MTLLFAGLGRLPLWLRAAASAAVLAGAAALLAPHSAMAQTSATTHSPLVGSWQLLSIEMRHADGRTSHPFGAQPQGRALYQANGSMSITLQRSQRRAFANDRLYAATAAEKASIADSFTAYAGRYVVQPARAIVQHHIELASFPNWNGSIQVRHYHLEGDILTLSTPATPEGHTELVWKRLP